MTAATNRRIAAPGGAVRWTWAAVVALLATLAVLAHHDMTAAAMRGPAMSAMPGMDHTSAAMTSTAAETDHSEALQSEAPATDGDGGACSGPAMQHCSSGDVGAPQLLVPPSSVPRVGHGDAAYALPAGHGPPTASHRAPPDLAVLSRLLI
ncbi:hypothetical protein [Streptomyces sp. NPDC006668]|uniref:hypothetical protein n=1 Tax=Streptomyces sp. NPDC006668 TaxID=3156903 RepID=UPI0033EA4A62